MGQPGQAPAYDTLATHEAEILEAWLQNLQADGALQSGRIREGELRVQCAGLLRQLRAGMAESSDLDAPAFAPLRDALSDLSASRAQRGFSPREIATFIFSLKQPLFEAMTRGASHDVQATWQTGLLVDRLGLLVMEAFQRTREEVIVRQQQEISELSTPVIKLWDGILALPLIGTLDSQRTQVVMENLLESIAQLGAGMAIIDITGVPTVDTLTAQHLLKTVAAARLMGADCIISGIRPQIAQTMVHLGVELTVVSKATLADAFALALSRQGRGVTRLRKPEAPGQSLPLG